MQSRKSSLNIPCQKFGWRYVGSRLTSKTYHGFKQPLKVLYFWEGNILKCFGQSFSHKVQFVCSLHLAKLQWMIFFCLYGLTLYWYPHIIIKDTACDTLFVFWTRKMHVIHSLRRHVKALHQARRLENSGKRKMTSLWRHYYDAILLSLSPAHCRNWK